MPLLQQLSHMLELSKDAPSESDLMNDWEIGGTQNKWVCPSDRHLNLRAQLKSGWSVRTATARSPTNSARQASGITEAEQEQIRQVLARAEAGKMEEQRRIGKMVDRLERLRARATGNGVTHCLLCRTEFGLLASKSYAAMCVDCRKYVCQRNCGVETLDQKCGELVFLCKICAESREVLWKKSGAWFYKELPEFMRPDAAAAVPVSAATPSTSADVRSPPVLHKQSWAQSSLHRRQQQQLAAANGNGDARAKSPRPRIQPSWVKEKVMSSMSVEDYDRSSSEEEGEFKQNGVPRRRKDNPGRQNSAASRREANLARFAMQPRMSETDESSSPESRPSSRSNSPRRSLATPSSYDSAHLATAPASQPLADDARSIDSGVVQSDHSNPQAQLTLSVSSLAPAPEQNGFVNQTTPMGRQSPQRVTQSASGGSLTTGALRERADSRPSPAPSSPAVFSPVPPTPGPPTFASPAPTTASPAPSLCAMDRLVSPAPSIGTDRRSSGGSQASTSKVSSESINHLPPAIERFEKREFKQETASFMSSPDEETRQPRGGSNSHHRYGGARGARANFARVQSARMPSLPSDSSLADVRRSASGLSGMMVGGPGSGPPSARASSCRLDMPRETPGTLGSIQFAVSYSSEKKELVVHLIKAKNLKAMDKNGLSDPYVKLHLIPGNTKATKLTSKTIPETLNPEWNEYLTYHGICEDEKARKTLRVTVLDRDRIGSDFLGETRVALKKIPSNGTKSFNLFLEQAIPVTAEKQQQPEAERGKLLIGLCYNIQQGSLFVKIKRCSELIGMDSSGFSDPYCKVSLTPITSKSHRQKTAIKKRTLNPEWNETLTFIVPFKDLPKKTLQVSVYDHDVAKSDDFIGGILLSAAAKDERGKQWIDCIENPGKEFECWHKLELDN